MPPATAASSPGRLPAVGRDPVAIGSGGPYALAAARALLAHSGLGARAIAEESLRIAADICIYTNQTLTIEELP